jgi:hypothetical protein
MKRWLLSMIMAGLWGGRVCGEGVAGEGGPGAALPNPDLGKCLSATAGEAAEAWTDYCAGLSPAARSGRCAAIAPGSATGRQEWCAAEWSNVTPSNMGPSVDVAPSDVTPNAGCEPQLAVGLCCTPPDSPIVIDVAGNGFDLTDAAGGVLFDIRSDGRPQQVAWTRGHHDDPRRGPDDVWLALDRNANGLIDGGAELFGNYTEQPGSGEPNGFIALAEFDRPSQGGNGDSTISRADRVFRSLRLWDDANHNGISERSELFGVEALGVAVIDLNYQLSRARDRHGNVFRYRARLHGAPGAHLGPFAYDVFLVATDPSGDSLRGPCPCVCERTLVIRQDTRRQCFPVVRWACEMKFDTNIHWVSEDVCETTEPRAREACSRKCGGRAAQGECQ